MTINPTAESGPLIMYLVDPGDRQQADMALAIAHTEVVDRIVAAQADGVSPSPLRYQYEPDPGYTGWIYALQATESNIPVALTYRAGIHTVSTFNGSLAANALLHVVCAEIVHTWQQEGLIRMHRDSEEWIAGGRDLQALMTNLNRFGTPMAADAAEILQFGELLQQELAQPA